MANLNKVFLMGNMTRDPELRYTPGGASVCEFGLAVNRKFTTRDGEKRDETLFVDVAMAASPAPDLAASVEVAPSAHESAVEARAAKSAEPAE